MFFIGFFCVVFGLMGIIVYIWILMKFRWVGLLVCISFFILGINNIVLLFILK